MKKISLKESIKKCEKVQGIGRYDYSLITEENYRGLKYKYPIKCNLCGKTTYRTLQRIIQGYECKICSQKKVGLSQRLTTKDFIEKARKVHKDKYIYDKVNYVDAKTPVIITCKIHGDFSQTPNSHLRGSGCKECGKPNITTENFIEKARKVHGDKYNYSKVNYTYCKDNITIICNRCKQEFLQTPNSHLRGKGCPNCGKEIVSIKLKSDSKLFIEKARKIYGDLYDYSNVNYINSYTKVLIKCNKCGNTFFQSPNNHLNGHGCNKCGIEISKQKTSSNRDDFIEKARKVHGDLYDYSNVVYRNCRSSVIIGCPKHGDFLQSPNCHLSGHGCPYCNTSKGEKEISILLKSKNINFIPQYRFDDCKDKLSLPFDFYLPDYNLCIEYDGEQHYKEVKSWGGRKRLLYTQSHDSIKTNYCKQNNISLLRIKFDEDIKARLNQFLLNRDKIEPQSIFDL